MRVDPLGESAVILRDLPAAAYEVAAQVAGLPGVVEAVPSYDTVGVYFDPDAFDPDSVDSWKDLSQAGTPALHRRPRMHVIPVCYELGEDLAEAAERLGLAVEALIGEHCSVTYQCHAIGFSPGFPYLGYLPDALKGLPRKAQPRTRVPAGSVGITGDQTGIYPQETPGGWNLIARTPLQLMDMKDAYFPIAPGDEVRFHAISISEFEQRLGQRL